MPDKPKQAKAHSVGTIWAQCPATDGRKQEPAPCSGAQKQNARHKAGRSQTCSMFIARSLLPRSQQSPLRSTRSVICEHRPCSLLWFVLVDPFHSRCSCLQPQNTHEWTWIITRWITPSAIHRLVAFLHCFHDFLRLGHRTNRARPTAPSMFLQLFLHYQYA